MNTTIEVTELITVKDLSRIIKIAESTIWKMVNEKRIPEPIRLGSRTRWNACVIAGWIEAGCPKVDAPAIAS